MRAPRIAFLCSFFAIAVDGAAAAAQSAKPPEVLVLATGGTIASTGNYYGDKGGAVTHITVEELTKAAPGIEKVATLSADQFSNVASGSIGPKQWLDLSKRINTAFKERPALAGVVVTHGTDTMEETAYFLDLTVQGDHPVIITGAMRPADAIGADGPANLYNAARAAAAPASKGRGAMVLMDDRLFAAREVTKTNTTRVETFQAPEHGPLAIADHDTIAFGRARPTHRRVFDVANLNDLPRVDIIYTYGGADSVLIDAAVNAGAKGIVIAGAGAGATTPGQSSAIRRAGQKGVIVVIGSRTGSGRVAGSTTRVSPGDLNVQKARILLMLALTQSSDMKELAKIFNDANGIEP
ncbi:MAG TPA: asparaginase [Gemmatimonadaceae bacterium]